MTLPPRACAGKHERIRSGGGSRGVGDGVLVVPRSRPEAEVPVLISGEGVRGDVRGRGGPVVESREVSARHGAGGVSADLDLRTGYRDEHGLPGDVRGGPEDIVVADVCVLGVEARERPGR